MGLLWTGFLFCFCCFEMSLWQIPLVVIHYHSNHLLGLVIYYLLIFQPNLIGLPMDIYFNFFFHVIICHLLLFPEYKIMVIKFIPITDWSIWWPSPYFWGRCFKRSWCGSYDKNCKQLMIILNTFNEILFLIDILVCLLQSDIMILHIYRQLMHGEQLMYW